MVRCRCGAGVVQCVWCKVFLTSGRQRRPTTNLRTLVGLDSSAALSAAAASDRVISWNSTPFTDMIRSPFWSPAACIGPSGSTLPTARAGPASVDRLRLRVYVNLEGMCKCARLPVCGRKRRWLRHALNSRPQEHKHVTSSRVMRLWVHVDLGQFSLASATTTPRFREEYTNHPL